MLTGRDQELNSSRAALLNNMTVALDKARRGRDTESKVDQYKQTLKKLEKDLGDMIECGNHLKDIYKNVKHYSVNHQQQVRDILDLAIMEAGELVPDASTQGIHLKQEENNRVTVVNGNDQNINLREGGGYRAILGALLRYACIKAQPDSLPFILFDEYFFTLSDTTTDAMKEIFLRMKKDITIVCIEQRKNAMDGILDAEYTFKKDDAGTTTVTKSL